MWAGGVEGAIAERKLKEDIAAVTEELESLQTAKCTVVFSAICWCVLFPCLFMVHNQHGTCHVKRLDAKMIMAEAVKADLENRLKQLQRYGQLPE